MNSDILYYRTVAKPEAIFDESAHFVLLVQ